MRKKLFASIAVLTMLVVVYLLVNNTQGEKSQQTDYVLMDIEPKDIISVISSTSYGTTELHKDETGEWICEGLSEYDLKTDIPAVYEALEAVSEIISEEQIVIKSPEQLVEYGLSPAKCTVAVVYGDKLQQSFQIGIKSPVSGRYSVTFDDGVTVHTMRGPMAELLMRGIPAYAAVNIIDKPNPQAILEGQLQWNDIEVHFIKKDGWTLLDSNGADNAAIKEESLTEYLNAASQFYLNHCVYLGLDESLLKETGIEGSKSSYFVKCFNKNNENIEEMKVTFGNKISTSGNYYAVVHGIDTLFEVSYYPIALLTTAAEKIETD